MTDLAARREARRRKILENSQSRLNKILGVPSTGNDIAQTMYYSTLHEPSILDTEIEPSILENNVYIERNSVHIPHSTVKDAAVQNVSKLERLLALKLHVLFTSIFVYILCFTQSQYIPYSIFIPFVLCEVTEILFNKKQKEEPSLLYLILLNKLSKDKINIIATILNISKKVFNDISIYIFTFVIMQLLMQYMIDTDE